jgi:aryl-alcohol dehydrogenase-like predicted oxidoreductase
VCLSGYNGALLSVLEMAARSTCANRLSKVASGWGCSEDVLDYCEKHGIGFIPWAPVATGRLSKSGSIDDITKAHGATPSQIAGAQGLALIRRASYLRPRTSASTLSLFEAERSFGRCSSTGLTKSGSF